jgi:hypothetical protein
MAVVSDRPGIVAPAKTIVECPHGEKTEKHQSFSQGNLA